MQANLLRPGSWFSALLVLLVLGLGRPALASHLLGGELTYRYLDANGPAAAPLRYELTVTVYNNCDGSGIQPRSNAYVGLYDQSTGQRLVLTALNYATIGSLSGVTGLMSIPQTSASACISPTVPSGCTVTGPSQPYILQKFVGVVNLPLNSAGYYAVFSDAARNVDVANLYDPGGQNLTLYTAMAPPTIPNRSPVFSDIAVAVICANDTTFLLNSAVDPDGDRLAYSFGQPYGAYSSGASIPLAFTPPPTLVPYQTVGGYGVATPFGAGTGKLASIDASSGIAQYSTPTLGKYVVAVDVKEYRVINGVDRLIGTTRRDLQLVVASCPSIKAPVLPAPTVTPRNYTVQAGSPLLLPITVTQRDNHPLQMTLTSELFDGTGGHDASLNGSQGTLTPGSITGTVSTTGASGSVTGIITFNTTCAEARATPYSVSLSVKDTGCAGKTVFEVFTITVTKPRGPTAIVGDATVCGLNTTRSYTASGGTAPSISWRAPGGTIVGSATANPVQVTWPTAGTFTLTARGISQYNCPTDSVSYTVTVAPGVALTITGNTSICAGSSTTLSISGASSYTVTGGSAAPLTGAGPFTLSPTTTTTYTINGTGGATGCVPSTQVTVTVQPAPAANVGQATRSACSSTPLQLGAAPVTGSTYSWSPATGLSSATVANPTLTLTNTTGAATTQTYTLTETSANGCVSTGTVAVTLNPAITAQPGAAVSACSGQPAQLGAAAQTGYTYSWSPVTGLNSATVANPLATLVNTTGAATTQTYTLTTTNTATGCTGTGTVVVTVNPAVTARPGAAVAICPGATGQLGVAPVAGYTYSWSPSTGLSSTTAANPTVTLANSTNSATTQTYTLTTTNTATGCTGTATVVVTVNPAVAAQPGAAITICPGSTGQLGATAVAGFSYSWSPATGLSSATSANPTVSLPNAGPTPLTQTYTLTTTNTATGCAGTATVVVTVAPPPTAQPGAAITICSGSNGQLGVAAQAGYSYSWSPSTGLSNGTAANPTVSLLNTSAAPRTQTYTLTTTSPAGCVATGTVAVTVNPLPVPQPGAAVSACSGQLAQLGAAPVSGYSYSWSPGTGLSSATVANPTVTLTNTTGSLLTQTYTLTVTNTATGCASTGTVAVAVSVPVAGGSIAADQTVCAGSVPAAFSSTGSNSAFDYTWESSPDNSAWAVIGGASGASYASAALTATTYFRRRATLGTCGSAVSNVVKITVTQPLQAAVALATPPQQCAGLPFTFTPQPTNAGSAPTYVWYVNNAPVATTATYTSTTLRDGDQVRVELTPTAGFCAVGPAAATVTIHLTPSPAPTVSIGANLPLPVCVGTTLVFKVAGTTNLGATATYQWQVDGAPVAGATGTSYTSSTLRNGQLVTVVLSTTTPCGPVAIPSAAVKVLIVAPVKVSAGPDKEIMEGEEVTLEATVNGHLPLTWTPLAGLTFVAGDTLHPRASPAATTTYVLKARTGDCTDSAAVTVTVRPRLRIPSAFSPNGDGQDDTWEIDHLGDYPANKVLVFNRWGNKVFEGSGYARGSEWNGSIGGQPAPIGTYYYIITLGNGRKYSGPITIVY